MGQDESNDNLIEKNIDVDIRSTNCEFNYSNALYYKIFYGKKENNENTALLLGSGNEDSSSGAFNVESPLSNSTPTDTHVTMKVQFNEDPSKVDWELNCTQTGLVFKAEAGLYQNSFANNVKLFEIPVKKGETCTISTLNTDRNDSTFNIGNFKLHYGQIKDIHNSATLIRLDDSDYGKRVANFTVKQPYEQWDQLGEDVHLHGNNETGGLFGWSVSSSSEGNIVVVGAPGYFSKRPGSAQVYRLHNNTWQESGQLSRSKEGNTDEEDLFGYVVRASGDGKTIAVSAPGLNNNTGAVYIFKRGMTGPDIPSWYLEQPIMGENLNDFFGSSLDISGDGSTIIVGANEYGILWSKFADGKGYAKVYQKKRYKGENNDGDNWTQIGKKMEGNTEGGGYGYSVATSFNGNVIGIGAPFVGRGYVGLFRYIQGEDRWDKFGIDDQLLDHSAGHYFGDSISLSSDGRIVAIGAPSVDGINLDEASRGSVKVFKLNEAMDTDTWEQLGKKIEDEDWGDKSGTLQGVSLSANGMVVAVGASDNDGNDINDSGSVRIFRYDNEVDDWIAFSQDINSKGKDDRSGISVSLNAAATKVVIGAPLSDAGDSFDSNRGTARVYELVDKGALLKHSSATPVPSPAATATTASITNIPPTVTTTWTPGSKTEWIQVGKDIDCSNPNDYCSPVSMSSSGDILVVGAPGGSYSQVYKLNSSRNRWEKFGKQLHGDTFDDGDNFGYAVSISKDSRVVATSTPHYNDGTGIVYIYNLETSTNTLELSQVLEGKAKHDHFGKSIQLSGDGQTIAIGADQQLATDGAGYVDIYSRKMQNIESNATTSETNEWVQVGGTISGEAAGDRFSSSIAFSYDGSIIAIGAPNNDNNGPSAGQVSVLRYEESSNSWESFGSNSILLGDRNYDGFGRGIALSSTGDVIAVAAPYNHGISGDQPLVGTVKVLRYNANTNKWEQLGGKDCW